MDQQERRGLQQRAVALTLVAGLALTALTLQLGNMTIVQRGEYTQVAEGQRTRTLPVLAPRGLIYDRNMDPLVENQVANSVFISYPHYNDRNVLQRLATILEISLDDIQEQIEEKKLFWTFYEPIRVKDGITHQQNAVIRERQHELPGVTVQPYPVRHYIYGESAAHLLGYVGEVNRDELERYEGLYVGGEQIGKTGLETYYEQYLRGEKGLREIEVNSFFEPLRELEGVSPKPGNSLVLTIDGRLQRAAELSLDWTMWRHRNLKVGDGPWPHAKAGAVVVMEVKTGKILAMASRPSFDPNWFARGITQAEYDSLQDPVLTPEINRAIHKAYQPASTWKMMTSAAALDAGVVGPYETVYCNGVYDKAGNPKDWLPWGHGAVDTVGALKTSCDIYYYEMGYRMGVDKLVDKAKEFGFGARTGIDLGAEHPGLLPDVETRRSIWEEHLNDPWGVGHTVSASIGQIVQATPVQLVRYTAAFGNEGKLMKPYLVDRIIDDAGNVVKQSEPEVSGQVHMQPEHLDVILRGMAAVDVPGGTSDFAAFPLPGMKTLGKTGTGEYPPWDDYAFYVGMAPAENPEIAVMVVIEQGGHGSAVSTVARGIYSEYFQIALRADDPARVPDEFPNNLPALRTKYNVLGSGH